MIVVQRRHPPWRETLTTGTPFSSDLTSLPSVANLPSKPSKNFQSETKANANSVYSDPGGGSRGHLGLVITTLQYVLISPIIFVYQNHPGPLVIMYGTTAHTNSNILIVHTNRMSLFQEVTGVKQALEEKIFFMIKEAYLVDICNRTNNYINDTVADV